METVLPVFFGRPLYLLLLLAVVPVLWLWSLSRRRSGRVMGPWRGRAILTLRVIILVLLTFGLAGLEWVLAEDRLAVVFVLDVSDSIDPAARAMAQDFIRSALDSMGPDDQVALVLYGADALVEWPMTAVGEALDPGTVSSAPGRAHTNSTAAIRLGLSLLPATAQRRIVLLSDGQDNVPGAEAAIALAAASGAQVNTVFLPVGTATSTEARIEAVDVPSVLYEGESFRILVHVQSDVAQVALLRLFGPSPRSMGDRLLAERVVALRKGDNVFPFDLSAGRSGLSTFLVQLVPERDGFLQNNALGAFATVRGAPRVLLAASSGEPDPAANLGSALASAGLQVDRSTPASLPADLASLGAYRTVILVDVPASALSSRQMVALQGYVRDAGRGLVCVGGPSSYGVGGYYGTPLEEVLPVQMGIRDKSRVPPLALAFVIDKSGSMGVSSRVAGGVEKLGLAKEAVIRSLEMLTPADQVGVIAFDDSSYWVYPSSGPVLARPVDVATAQQRVGTIRAAGGTDIYAGLYAAVTAMESSDATGKHVILLTDGGASTDGLAALVGQLRVSGATLSTVGVGQDAASFLRSLALDGGGRYHYTDDPTTIPRIFAQETALARRSYIVGRPFFPARVGQSPILENVDALPLLYGYVATTLKPAAQPVLASDLGDPVLAQWQYGLGRAVAWTSDAKGQWALEWTQWEQFARFWGQIVRWTIVQYDDSGMELQVADRGERMHLAVQVLEDDGSHANDLNVGVRLVPSVPFVGPGDDRTRLISLMQTAPGLYEGEWMPGEDGTYLVSVTAAGSDGASQDRARTLSTGLVRPYSPEYRAPGGGEAALQRLAKAGGGHSLRMAREEDASAVFAHDLPGGYIHTSVWPWLLAVAVCLLPLDVGVRRLAIDREDLRRWLRQASDWVRRWRSLRLRVRRMHPSDSVGRLLAAKQRALGKEKPRSGIGPFQPELDLAEEAAHDTATAPLTSAAEGGLDVQESASEPDSGPTSSMTARLLAAKRRTRRENGPR